MALPVPNTTLAKKKKPTDGLDDLVSARMGPAKSETAVEAVGKPVAEAARAGTIPKTTKLPKGEQTATFSAGQADPLDDLADQRAAAAAEIDASNAKQQMDARSRAGLGGLGLSGGAQAGASDMARQQARTKALTMADFDKMAEDREFTDIQRDATVDEAELAADFDYNDDGFIGGEKVGGKIGDRDVENDPAEKPKDAADVERAMAEAKSSLRSRDLFIGDPDTAPGTIEEPFEFDSMAALAKWFRDTTGMEPEFSSQDRYGNLVIKDQFGNYYTLAGQ